MREGAVRDEGRICGRNRRGTGGKTQTMRAPRARSRVT